MNLDIDWRWTAVGRGDYIRELVSTLQNYGDHHEWCARTPVCTCGFDTLIARGESLLESFDAAPDATPEERAAYDADLRAALKIYGESA